MAKTTLLEYTNELDAIQRRFDTDIAQRDAEINSLKVEKEKLHKGMNRKTTALQKTIAKAAELNSRGV